MLDLAGKRVTVMGLGRFGGGLGVTRWLAAQGAQVLVTDLAPAEQLVDSVRALDGLIADRRVTLRLGAHQESDFTSADLVIANPAVPRPWTNPFLSAAAGAGVPIATEISLLIQRLPSRARTIGITGSVGKSTTTAMIAHALGQTVGDTVLGGNIGGSLLDSLPAISTRTRVVLELSSAMLHWIDLSLAWSPAIAIATNFSENHLDWHGEVAHYRTSKQHLLRHQQPGDTAVLGQSVADWRSHTRASVQVVDPASFTGDLKIPGAHNRVNAAAALAACRAAAPETTIADLTAALATFPGLPHRLQLVAEHRGLRFYNDSKSTTPDATLRAVEAIASMPGMTERAIHLIAGGYDKKIDLSPIAALGTKLGGLYTVGATGRALAAQGRGAFAETVERAVERALARMSHGNVLLLSPGCASWDQFTNYEQRGEAFAAAVRAGMETSPVGDGRAAPTALESRA